MSRSFTRDEVVAELVTIMHEMLIDWKPEDGEHVHVFDDLGLDSLDGHDMVVQLEEIFDLQAGEEDFMRTLTMRTIINAICDKLDEVGRFVR